MPLAQTFGLSGHTPLLQPGPGPCELESREIQPWRMRGGASIRPRLQRPLCQSCAQNLPTPPGKQLPVLSFGTLEGKELLPSSCLEFHSGPQVALG